MTMVENELDIFIPSTVNFISISVIVDFFVLLTYTVPEDATLCINYKQQRDIEKKWNSKHF